MITTQDDDDATAKLHILNWLLGQISQKMTKCYFNSPCYCLIYTSNKYDHQMPNICHMSKLLDVQQGGSISIYMPYTNLLPPMMSPKMLYTDDKNNAGQ